MTAYIPLKEKGEEIGLTDLYNRIYNGYNKQQAIKCSAFNTRVEKQDFLEHSNEVWKFIPGGFIKNPINESIPLTQSGVIGFEFDMPSNEDLKEVKSKIASSPLTMMCAEGLLSDSLIILVFAQYYIETYKDS